jgi:hypothetical protein
MNRSDYVYRDPRPYARALVATQGLYAVCVLANLAVIIGIMTGQTAFVAYAETSDLAFSLGYVIAVITFAVWNWRVVANANTFKPTMNAKPWWSLGWYVVPIAYLWKPYQYIEETWDVSSASMSREPATLLRWWWGLWLGSMFLSFFAQTLSRASAADGGNAGTWMFVVALVIRLVLVGLVIRMALQLSDMQEAKRKGGGAAEVFA